MILPPRTLAIRLTLWTALFAYAVWKLTGGGADDAPEPPADVLTVDPRVPLTRPGAASRTVDAPDVVDIEAAVAAMDAAAAALATCGVAGTFSVRLDATGLAEAWIVPAGPLSDVASTCASLAAWAPPWPHTTQGFEMESRVE